MRNYILLSFILTVVFSCNSKANNQAAISTTDTTKTMDTTNVVAKPAVNKNTQPNKIAKF
ncbi:MAG: hypothetical protein HYZ42_15055, partial [Bacteroidetes bacterium]|nr:hypothetical protein [Bacteroidota bacterium]